MKKITKPAEKEESVYYSDFSGKCFGDFHPPVELTIEFNYGSEYDGSKLKFDLDDKDIKDVLAILKSKLSNDTKKILKATYIKLDDRYEDSIQARDWTGCEFICHEKKLLEKII